MKRIVNKLLIGLALVGLVWQTSAITSDAGGNPYQELVVRNTFGLKPVPDVTIAPPPPAQPPNQVKLVGFWQYLDKRQVFLKVTEPPKPGTPPKEIPKTLNEGERWGSIEVLAIDLKARTVKLDNSGQVTILALADFITATAAPPPRPRTMPNVPMPLGLPQLTPEEQAVVMEVERLRTKEAVARGELPPLPLTPLTPPGSHGIAPP